MGSVTVGIDLAAQPAGTAACRVGWSESGAKVEALAVDLDDAALGELRSGAAMVGIDAPFGWPQAFAAAVGAWASDRRWPEADPDMLRYRATDRDVRDRLCISPLSASADRIGVCAWRAARLLTAWGVHDLLGADGVVEAYPAAALRQWGLPFRGYKARTPQARERTAAVRAGIIAALRQRCRWLQLTDAEWGACQDSHDRLDALVCALLARAVTAGAVTPPAPEQMSAAAAEGWIQVPEPGSLDRLTGCRRDAR